MKAVVLYESVYGNTEAVARAVAEGLAPIGEVTLGRFGELPHGVLGRSRRSASAGCGIMERVARMGRIGQYRFGRIVVDGQEHTRDLIILPERVVPNWWRAEGHSLILDDLEDVLTELPARLVVGTGASGQMRPDPDTLEALRSRGIEVTVAPTDEAVRLFAQADPASTAAALHLTC